MAIKAATELHVSRNVAVYKWVALDAADTITPLVPTGAYSDAEVYFLKGGAFGGNLGMTVSPDPALTAATFIPAKDITLTAISSKTADGGFLISDVAYAYAPTAGAGAAAVDVYLVLRSNR